MTCQDGLLHERTMLLSESSRLPLHFKCLHASIHFLLYSMILNLIWHIKTMCKAKEPCPFLKLHCPSVCATLVVFMTWVCLLNKK